MASGTIRVEGLRELTRAFKAISKDLDKEVVDGLKDAAEPVKRDAEALAMGRITNMTTHWSQMRIGVSRAKGLVFMVPLARRAGGRPRPNLSPLMLERAMDPAVNKNSAQIIHKVDAVIGHLAGQNGF